MKIKILGSGGGEGYPATFCGCDHCNTAIRKGYYVAVLNSVLCEKCYKSWHHRAKNYPEDRRIEESNFNRMKSILNL